MQGRLPNIWQLTHEYNSYAVPGGLCLCSMLVFC